jgi:hypothetical protein
MKLRPNNILEVPNAGFGGVSWSQFLPAINLYCCGDYEFDFKPKVPSKKYIAIHIDIDGEMEVIKVFSPKSIIEYTKMIKTLIEWNYGTCKLCPVVKMCMDATS